MMRRSIQRPSADVSHVEAGEDAGYKYQCGSIGQIDILAWSSLKPETQKKLLGGNADRFFKQS